MHRLALLEPEKFHRVCQTRRRMYPAGYMSLSWVTQGFLRASTGHGKRVCPLSLPVIGQRALGNCVARIVRAARTARPFGEGRVPARLRRINGRPTHMGSRHLGGHWDNGRLARCTRPSSHPTNLSERTHSKTLSLYTSTRNRLCPQTPSVNQRRAKKGN